MNHFDGRYSFNTFESEANSKASPHFVLTRQQKVSSMNAGAGLLIVISLFVLFFIIPLVTIISYGIHIN